MTIRDLVKDFVQGQIDLIKAKAVNQGGKIISGSILGVVLGFLGFFILMFLSLSVAYAISNSTEKPYLGFLIVGGFYLLLAITILLLKDKILSTPILNSLLHKFHVKKNHRLE